MPNKHPSVAPQQSGVIHLQLTEEAGLDDFSLAANLREACTSQSEVLVVANGFTTRVLAGDGNDTEWRDIGHGGFGDHSKEAVGPLLRARRLLWATTSALPTTAQTISSGQLSTATVKTIKTWQKGVQDLTAPKARKVKGRQAEASTAIRQIVSAHAAWRCQFPGCGVDLREHASTGQQGNFSYFAHIVASSADGPRGSVEESARLADDPSNFLLLCDSCHRLIDRVSPTEYPTEKLHAIRDASIAEVSRLLDTLRYREVKPYAILGNLGNQVAYLSSGEVREALWNSKLRCSKDAPETLFQPGNHLYKDQTATYWGALFEKLRQEIPQVQRYINGASHNGGDRTELAIFPLHLTSVLVLAGHILGDNGGIHLFQPHRDKVGEALVTRWAWSASATSPSPEKYKVRTLGSSPTDSEEACLLVSLTFGIDPARLPEHCYKNGQWVLPALEVYVDEPSPNVISHPEDLQLFGKQFDDALRTLQDRFRAKKIHLIVGAPATAAVVIGQKMQARHHAPFICHESIGGPQAPFRPSIKISSAQVTELASGATCSLQP
ncbi:SAVED domain-containing protein [Castellaniella sp.]|uniref:SAVED domain-containing protein n=1 Tax=Castellaniella sp. TaxID=1955812 RepID=UPI002AFF6F8D|nr:SAVED domain-containing protein [Castellaniella sp.]